MPETRHASDGPTRSARRSRRGSCRRSAATLVAALAIVLPPLLLGCGGGAPVEETSPGAERPAVGEEPPAPPPDVVDPGEGPEADDEAPSETPPSDSATEPPAEVRIFLVVVVDDGEGSPQADTFGCGDRLRAVAVPVGTEGLDTAGRIGAALEKLLEATGEGGLYTAFGDSELTVEQVTPVAGVEGLFRVRLAGQLRLGGVCDHPRVRAQIEATARQFEGVEEVEVLIDGEPLDALLTGR